MSNKVPVAEVIGTFLLVFLGCGAAITTGANVVATGLTFGLTVAVVASTLGRLSGAHLNPAVTVAAAASGRMAWRDVPQYVISQLVGALAAGLSLFVIFQSIPGFETTGHLGQNGFGDHSGSHIAWWGAFIVEALLTAIFVLVILAATDNRAPNPALAPIAIGTTLAVIHFVAIGLTGTSVNPARSIGPGLFAGGDAAAQLWLFILAPLLGAVIAGAAYPALIGADREPVSGSGINLSALPALPALPSLPKRGATPAPASASATEETTEIPAAAAAYPQRIIQDGWEWDYEAQEWKPASPGE